MGAPTSQAKLKEGDCEVCIKVVNDFIKAGSEAKASSPDAFNTVIKNVCKDAQICELAYEKQLDWSTIDLKKMRVKGLKKILGDWGEDCNGCLEKGDFIKRIEELKPKHVKEEL